MSIARVVAGSGSASLVSAQLKGVGVRAGIRGFQVTRHFGQLLLTKVQAHSSGRPGPMVRTGGYRRSHGMRMISEGGNPMAVVGTNHPAGRRLEFGFVGVDALGRSYNQPPYPHYGPALDEIEEAFVRAIAAIARFG